jgi:Putative SAM-dependent methyltransferase
MCSNAYVFKYASAHADYLDGIIQKSNALREVLGRDKVSITCIGGGPGSDVLGFLKFLLERGDSPHIKYFILDKEPAWAETWSDLDDIVTGDLRPSRQFQHFDVTDPSTYEKFNRVFESDIFTMIYFLSEVFAHKDAVTRFLQTCFARMRKGALLIVIDFKNADLQNWIDQCSKEAGLEGGGKEAEFFMDSSEQKSALKKYAEKFDIEPKIKSQVFYRLFRKS